jgi:hypothetical protein
LLRWAHILITIAACFAGGCGKAPPPPIVAVEGIVRLEGRPLKRAEIRFLPAIEHGAEYVAVGVTDDNGQFKLICKGQAGACACDNFVLIGEAPLPAELRGENAQAELARYFQKLGGRPIPPKYANLADNALTAKVVAGAKAFEFNLSR